MLSNGVIDSAEFKSALNFQQGLLLHCNCGSFCQKSVSKSSKTSGSEFLPNTPLPNGQKIMHCGGILSIMRYSCGRTVKQVALDIDVSARNCYYSTDLYSIQDVVVGWRELNSSLLSSQSNFPSQVWLQLMIQLLLSLQL